MLQISDSDHMQQDINNAPVCAMWQTYMVILPLPMTTVRPDFSLHSRGWKHASHSSHQQAQVQACEAGQQWVLCLYFSHMLALWLQRPDSPPPVSSCDVIICSSSTGVKKNRAAVVTVVTKWLLLCGILLKYPVCRSIKVQTVSYSSPVSFQMLHRQQKITHTVKTSCFSNTPEPNYTFNQLPQGKDSPPGGWRWKHKESEKGSSNYNMLMIYFPWYRPMRLKMIYYLNDANWCFTVT